MKKLIALLLALTFVFCLFGCNSEDKSNETKPFVVEGAMTYKEYSEAEYETDVTIACYVQATQSWWEKDGKGVISVYAADKDGAYFLYEMACSEEDAAKLVPGTLIKVTGVKIVYSGLIEVSEGTFEFVKDAPTYIAEPVDLTEKLDTADLINYQNQLASFNGLTVKEISYKNGEPGDDIYLTLSKGDKDYSFCVECYLTDPDTEVYKTVGTLKAGDTVDVEGFLYWWEGMNPHITKITVK